MRAPSIRPVGSLLDWFLDTGVSHFDLAIQRRDHAGLAQDFLAPSSTHAQQLESTGVQRRLPWLCAENARGGDVYFRPFRHGAWPVVFLDDLPIAIAIRIAGKYRAAVVETSSGNAHLWLATTLPLNEAQRAGVQRDLVTRLQGAADPGSISGDHWGRLPGFRNHKPNRGCWVNLHSCTHARPYLPTLPVTPHPVTTTRSSPRREHTKPDMSRLEWGWVLGCLEHGWPATWVQETLIERARHRRGQADAIRYARYTVGKACRLKGLHEPHRGGS